MHAQNPRNRATGIHLELQHIDHERYPKGIVGTVELRSLRYFVAVAEERHVGRAAARLNMTQPPLSRAIRQLESELGVQLLNRTPSGVELTEAGEVLLAEAHTLLDQSDRLRSRVAGVFGRSRITLGSLADTAELVGTRLVEPFRRRHPQVSVDIHEFDLADPTAGLRRGAVDVALTRTPFDSTGLRVRILQTQPVGVVVREADPLVRKGKTSVAELTDRRWIRLPANTDPAWTAYWTGPSPDEDRPEVRTIGECVQSVLWDGLSALAPLYQLLPPGLTVVPVNDRAPSELVLAWRADDPNPLVRSFVDVAVDGFRIRSRKASGAKQN